MRSPIRAPDRSDRPHAEVPPSCRLRSRSSSRPPSTASAGVVGRRSGTPMRASSETSRGVLSSASTCLLSAACFGGVTTCSPSAGSRDGARAVGRPGTTRLMRGACLVRLRRRSWAISVVGSRFSRRVSSPPAAVVPAGFGELLAWLATALIAAILWDVGVSVLVQREVAARHVDGRGAIRRALGLRLMALPAWVAAFGLGVFLMSTGYAVDPWSSALFASTSLATGVRLPPAAVLRANSPVSRRRSDSSHRALGHNWPSLAGPCCFRRRRAASGTGCRLGRASWSLSPAPHFSFVVCLVATFALLIHMT